MLSTLLPPPQRRTHIKPGIDPQPNHTLVLLDGMALCYPFANAMAKQTETMIRKMITNWVGIMQRPQLYLPQLHPHPPTIVPIILWDEKNEMQKYWRHSIHPGYKGGRKAKSTTVSFIAKELKQLWSQAGMLSYSLTSFEADDWAGYIVKNRPENGRVILFTLDSDWGQLIEPNVHWMDSYSRAELRSKGRDRSQGLMLLGEAEFLDKINNHPDMQAYPISTPSELVDNKWVLGDSSDSIPSGQQEGLRGIIDLRNPKIEIPHPPNVWKESVKWSRRQPTPLYIHPRNAVYMINLPEFSEGLINYETGKVYQPYEPR